MDFSTPTTLAPMLTEVRAFVDEWLIPLETDIGKGFYALEDRLNKARAEVKKRGWWQPQVPKEAGGMGLNLVEHGLVSEVLGRTPFGHYALGCQAPDAGNLEILLEFGSDSQKEQWLAPLLSGESRSCFGMTEPEHAGSNPIELSTNAVKSGTDWILNGHKWFCTAADGAAFCIVMAVTDPDAAPHERASMIIVPTDAPGFEMVRNISIMGEPGDGWLSHSEIRLTNVRVPKNALLGEQGKGFKIAQARLGPGRIHHCMRWMGICQRSLEMLAKRALSRKIRAGQVLADQQTIQNWLAEGQANVAATRLLILATADQIDREGSRAASENISLIKFHASEVMMTIIDRAIQVYGAAGITDDVILSWFYRHERGCRIYDGPDEVHKSVVSRKILSRQRRKTL